MDRLYLRAQARIGLTYLEGAVLGVMFEASGPLQPHEISKQLCIPAVKEAAVNYNALVTHILDMLADKGLVKQLGRYQPWELTSKAIQDNV